MLFKHSVAFGSDKFVADMYEKVQAFTYLYEAQELQVTCGVGDPMADQVVGELVGLAVHLVKVAGEPLANIGAREQHAELDLELHLHLLLLLGIKLLQ
jgi:hypothetical protein